MLKLKLYTKPGCWLCDTADETLRGLALRYSLEVERVDITTDDEIYDLYRFDIPVIEFPDGATIYGRIKKKVLLEKLDSLTGSSGKRS